ncbi:MAG: acyltransferase [Lachnospiraceae bacterium]|nr:acyltransferase [Lachnospiraceae bacterium]
MNEQYETNDLKRISTYRGALMGLAALWIYFFHLWTPLLSDVGAVAGIEKFLKRAGFCGVDIFLLLSGIGLTYAIGKTGLLKFWYRRVRRLIVPTLAIGIIRAIDETWTASAFIKNVSGWNFWFKSMYSFVWFVPAIVTLYLLFPLLWKAMTASSQKMLFLFGFLEVWLLLSLVLEGTLRADLYGFTNRIPVFVVGVFLGWTIQHKTVTYGLSGRLFLLATGILGVYLSYRSNFKGMRILVPTSNCCIPNLLMSVSFCGLFSDFFALIDSTKAGKAIQKVTLGILAFYGSFSLEFYVLQEWLGGKLKSWLPAVLTSKAWLSNISIFLIVTAAGYLLHLLSEGVFFAAELPFKPKKGEKTA